MEIHPKLDFDEVLWGLLKDSDAEDAKAPKHTYGKCIEFCRTKYNGKREVFVHINTENGSCHIDVDPDVENLQCRKIDFIILTLEKIAKELKKYDSDCTLR